MLLSGRATCPAFLFYENLFRPQSSGGKGVEYKAGWGAGEGAGARWFFSQVLHLHQTLLVQAPFNFRGGEMVMRKLFFITAVVAGVFLALAKSWTGISVAEETYADVTLQESQAEQILPSSSGPTVQVIADTNPLPDGLAQTFVTRAETLSGQSSATFGQRVYIYAQVRDAQGQVVRQGAQILIDGQERFAASCPAFYYYAVAEKYAVPGLGLGGGTHTVVARTVVNGQTVESAPFMLEIKPLEVETSCTLTFDKQTARRGEQVTATVTVSHSLPSAFWSNLGASAQFLGHGAEVRLERVDTGVVLGTGTLSRIQGQQKGQCTITFTVPQDAPNSLTVRAVFRGKAVAVSQVLTP